MNKFYRYKAAILAQIWLPFIFQFVFLWGFGLHILFNSEPGASAFPLGLILIAFSLLGSALGLRIYFQHLPIVVTDEGLSCVFFGKTFKPLKWKNINRIEKIHYPDAVFSLNKNSFRSEWHKYVFVGKDKTFWVDDGLKDLRDFLDKVNFYAHQYKIEIVFVDRMPSARKLVEHGNFTSEEKNKFREEGLRHSLLEL